MAAFPVYKYAQFIKFAKYFIHAGELPEGCTNDKDLWSNDTLPRCPDSVAQDLVPVLMGVYILITNVLMLNLLIAMFR